MTQDASDDAWWRLLEQLYDECTTAQSDLGEVAAVRLFRFIHAAVKEQPDG